MKNESYSTAVSKIHSSFWSIAPILHSSVITSCHPCLDSLAFQACLPSCQQSRIQW